MGTERLVTGAEAGISGDEQIRIALQTIVENGGIAEMPQIYDAVEPILRKTSSRLSVQGKASLRFFVNKVAVEAGYIYPHDKKKPGWRITPKGREYIEVISLDPEKSAGMITEAGDNFQFSLSDVYTLLEADYIEETKTEAEQRLGAFKRAGVILTVTAWETYVEDVLELLFCRRLEEPLTPDDIQSTFNAVAQAWLTGVGGKPQPPDMAKWAGEGWKQVLLDKFDDEISRFNTPNSQNVKKLFERYLDLDVTDCWKWKGMSSQKACQKLDALIELRGELVHRGGKSSQTPYSVERDQLMDMIALVEQLAWSIEVTWGKDLSEQ